MEDLPAIFRGARSVLFVGEPGSGKSAQLAAVASSASVWPVVRIDAARTPSALRVIVDRLGGWMPALSPAHREALQADAGPSLLRIAALLSLLTEVGPGLLLILIDDADQLDPGSAEVLIPLARRLAGTPIRMIATVVPDGRPRLERSFDAVREIPPLSPDEASKLLREHFPALSEAARARVVEAAGGNPGALIEQASASPSPSVEHAADSLEGIIAAAHQALDSGQAVGTAQARLAGALLDPAAEPRGWVLDRAMWALYLLGCFDEDWADFASVAGRYRHVTPGWVALPRRSDLAAADRLVEDLAGERDPSVIIRVAFLTRTLRRRAVWRTAVERVWSGTTDDRPCAGLLLGQNAIATGDWDTAQRITTQALELSGHRTFPGLWLRYHDALLAAYREDAATVRERVEPLLASGIPALTRRAHHCLAVAALAAGDPASAHRHLAGCTPPFDEEVALDFAEAGHPIAAPPTPPGTRWALQVAGYEEALSQPDADRWPFDVARIRLAYGRKLRTDRNPAEARNQLRLAAATFRHLGASPWLALATSQLRALGSPDPQATPAASELSAMEHRIADLAAAGQSNREIAAALQLTAATVGGHLSRIYTKLGINSRAVLREALKPRSS